MFRLLVLWVARLAYVWKQEFSAATHDLNAGVAAMNAQATRDEIAQLNAEADAIDENIKKVEAEEEARKATPEYQALDSKTQYEDEQKAKTEKNQAVNIAAAKRNQAKELAAKVTQGEQAAQFFRSQATASRALADKLRSL